MKQLILKCHLSWYLLARSRAIHSLLFQSNYRKKEKKLIQQISTKNLRAPLQTRVVGEFSSVFKTKQKKLYH